MFRVSGPCDNMEKGEGRWGVQINGQKIHLKIAQQQKSNNIYDKNQVVNSIKSGREGTMGCLLQ